MNAANADRSVRSPSGIHPRGRPFLKMHGLRNHFVIVDGRDTPYRPEVAEIVRICDPEVGVGGDQLVVIEPADSAADAFMRLFNVDGREVEACGNATRCVAWLLMEESMSDHAAIETLAGILDCRRVADHCVSCDMGRVSMEWSEIPLAQERDTLHLDLTVGALSDPAVLNVGNPHAVFFVDDVDAVELSSIAPAIQKNPLFPEQVNVGVAQLIDDAHLKLRVYERGAGLTMACGSGAGAASYAAHARRLTASKRLTVTLPAGDVEIAITENDHAIMSGPVAFCFSGYL